MSWYFADIEAEGVPLRFNGNPISIDAIKKMAGKAFKLEVGENVLSFDDAFGALQLTLNGTSTHTVNGGVHLSLSEMACCIGEKCLLWPPPQPKQPQNKLAASAGTGGYAISEVEVEEVTLKINGKTVSAEELKSYAGKTFDLSVDNHVVHFEAVPPSSAKLTLNGKTTVSINEPLHLNFSQMAVCIGTKCLPWPAPALSNSSSSSNSSSAAFSPYSPEPFTEKFMFDATPTEKFKFDAAPTEKFTFDASPASSWSISELTVEPGTQLKVDGKPVTTDQARALGGKQFTLYANKNHVTFEDSPSGGVNIRLNSNSKATLAKGSLHLDISSNAVCIGDKCLPWPAIPAEAVSPIIDVLPAAAAFAIPQSHAAAVAHVSTDDAFLASVKSKLGEQDYAKLLTLLRPTAGAPREDPHKQYRKQVKHADNLEEWDSFIAAAGNKPVIVDCSAIWCKPCKRIAPMFAKISKEYGTDAVFIGLDVDDNHAVKERFTIDSLPSFLFIKNGKEVGRLEGDNVDDLRSGIKNFVLSSGEKIDIPSAIYTFVKKDSSANLAAAPALVIPPPKIHYDYIVIGGGSGGMASAKEAAKLGAQVAVFDYVKPSTQKTTWGLGGTCVNVGCVPKKLMHYASLVGETLHHDAPAYGFEVNDVKHNWSKLVETVQEHVRKLNFFYEKGLKTAQMKDLRNGTSEKVSNGSVTYFNALGTLIDKNTVKYHNEKTGESGTITGKNILISTGGRPHVPSTIPGALELSITSDDLFSLQRAPGRTLCVGAGYISLECGGFLRGLGYPVTVAVRSVPLRTGGFDRQCVDKMVNLMEMNGTRFLMKTDIKSLTKTEKGTIKVKFFKTETQVPSEWEEEFDTVLYATGRGADTAKLNLSAVGVKTTSRGTVIADESDKTSIEGIYAIGDVVEGRPELTPVAIQAGEYLARRLFDKSTKLMDYHNIPTTVFTPFEYGIVGYSEEEAIKKYGEQNIEIYLSEFTTLEIGAAHRIATPPEGIPVPEEFPTNSLAKLVCLKTENERVIGAHFVGPNAGEITQSLAVAVRLRATKKDFDETVGIHPTDAESFTTLFVKKSSGEQWESAGGCGGGKCG